jgi:hypothetical protein
MADSSILGKQMSGDKASSTHLNSRREKVTNQLQFTQIFERRSPGQADIR